MPLKNPNETNYVGGRKHWTDVIKNRGNDDLLVYRQPEEDFNDNSTLIVMPGEEAVFINNGEIEHVFGPGRYLLNTENYPFISRLRNAFSGGVSSFNCVVYFINKTRSKEIFWGTATPIQIRDKKWNVRTDVRCRGSYTVMVDNETVLLGKLLGGNSSFVENNDLNDYFFHEFQEKIKSIIGQYLDSIQDELIGIDQNLMQISEQVKPLISSTMEQYGIKCITFSVSGIDVDRSKYDRIDNAQIEALEKVTLAQGDLAAMKILGDDWAKIKETQILTNISKNPSSGGMAGVAAGLGVALNANNSVSSMSNGLKKEADQTANDPVELLMKLKKMLDADLITQEDYNNKKEEILNRM